MYKFDEKSRMDSAARKISKLSHDECWEWTGARNREGYGCFWENGRKISAHRYVWQLFFGPIPKGKMILHRCNNPSCVNPYHLYLGSGSDNARDKIEDGYIHKERIPKTLYETYKNTHKEN